MTILKTVSVDRAKVKSRWQEPYVSSSINRELSGIPRGVYRGFEVTQQAVPDKGISIKLGTDNDSFLLHESSDSAYKLAVRYDAEFDVDFEFDASGSPLTLYVWCDVEYAIGSDTLAYIRVGASADRNTDSINICKIEIPQSATTIINSYITQDIDDEDTITTPIATSGTLNKWGLVPQSYYSDLPTGDQKDAMDNASPAPNASNPFATEANTVEKIFARPRITSHVLSGVSEFQLTGTVFVGTGAQGSAQIFFGLHANDSGSPEPTEIGFSTADTPLTIDAIYNSTNTTELTPSSDADANGFYTNPYIHLSESVTGTYWVRHGAEENFSDLGPNAILKQAKGFIPPIGQDIAFNVSASTARKPVTYTVGPDTSDNYDFGGASGLVDALDALEASSLGGGVIYVRGAPAFTVTTNKTYTKSVQILFENQQDAHVTITFSHSSGTGITFTKPTEINGGKWTGVGLDIIAFDGPFVLRGCRFEGRVFFTAYIPGYGSTMDNCYFPASEAVFDGCHYTTVSNCRFYPPADAWAVEVDQCTQIAFKNCLIDGSKSNTQDGQGLYVHDAYNITTFEDCYFVHRGTQYRSILVTANSASNIHFRNCYVLLRSNWGNHTDYAGQIEFYLNAAVANVTIDNMNVFVGHSTEIDNTIFYVAANNPRGRFIVNGLRIDGAENVVNGHNAAYRMGAAMGLLVAGSGTQVQFNDVSITRFSHCNVGYTPSNLIGTQVSNTTAKLGFQNLQICNLSATTVSSDTFLMGLVNTSVAGQNGILTLDNCVFDATGLTINHTYLMYHVGIYGIANFGVEDPGVMYITNCKFANWARRHISQDDDDGEARIIINNYRGYDTIALDSTVTSCMRLYLRCERVIVTNSMYHRTAAHTAGLVWCQVSWAGPGLQKPVIMGNSIWMTNGASDYGIYMGDAVNSGTIIGNVGDCYISARNVDNLIGIGDGDYNTNGMGITLR